MFAPDNMHERELQQKLELLGDPDRVQSNPALNSHCRNMDGDEHNIQWMVWFPIVFGHGSPWEASAQSLGDFHKESNHWALPWMLLFMLMGPEDHDLGTPSFAINQNSSQALWKRVLKAFVKNTYYHDTRKDVVALIDMYRRRSPMFDPAVSDMIKTMRETVRKEFKSNASDNNNNDGHVDHIEEGRRGGIPPRRPNDLVDDHRVRIERHRIERRRIARIAQVRREHPDWSAVEAQEFVNEEIQNEGRREIDDAFADMDNDDFWGNDSDDGSIELVNRAQDNDRDMEDALGEDGDPEDPEGVEALVARQQARVQIDMRGAQERRVETWCMTLSPIVVIRTYGGNLTLASNTIQEQRDALISGTRETSRDDLPHIIEAGITSMEPPFVWPLVPCTRPPVPDVSDILGNDVEESIRNDGDVYARMCNGEAKVVTKMFLFDGEADGDKHCLIGIGFRDDIQFSRLVHKIKTAQNHRSTQRPGGGRRAFGNWVDPYRHLMRFKSFHPAYTYKQEVYIKACKWFMQGQGGTEEDLNRTAISSDQFSNIAERYHPSKVCTLARALTILRRAGAKLKGLTKCDFVTRVSADDGKREILTLHTPPNRVSWTFDPLQVFWYNKNYLGMSQTLLPFRTERDDLPLQLITGKARIDHKLGLVFVEDEKRDNGDKNHQFKDCMIGDNPDFDSSVLQYEKVVDKRRTLQSIPSLLEYRHGDVLVHYEAENKLARRKVESLLPGDPLEDPEQYELYCGVQDQYRESTLSKFCSIWVVNGVVDHLATCSTIKAVLLYGNELLNPRKNPGRLVTCHLPMFDTDMTAWGNGAINKMVLLSKGCTIINCKIPFLAGGMLMTFDMDRPGKPRTNIQLNGPGDVGKTFPFIDFVKKNYIKKTWDDQHRASAKAQNVHTHFPPTMMLCDEPPKYVTDSKAEDRYYEEVQQMKNALVSGQHTYSVFKIVEHEGREVRTNDNVKTKDPRTFGFCTNQPRDKDHPLGTRFFMISVPRPIKPPEDYQYDPGKLFPENVRIFFHTEQFLVVEALTAMRIGAIPDIDMWLFKLVMKRLVATLRVWNVLDPRKGYRPIQIMEPFVRYESLIRAIACVRHVPGGALYNKAYDARDVVKLSPHLRPTLEIIKSVVTMTRQELIDEDARTVAQGICDHCSYDPNLTPVENYATLSWDRIPFGRHRNPDYDKSDTNKDHPEWIYDVNVISIYGRIESIAQLIMPRCKGLSTVQVSKIMLGLTKRTVKMKNNKKYKLLTIGLMEAISLSIPIILDNGNSMIPDEAGVLMDCDVQVPAATFTNSDDKSGRYLLNPSILYALRDDVIDRAWLCATMHKNYPQGKFINGRIDKDYPDLFNVDIYDSEFIEAYCTAHDENYPNAPMKRMQGLSINHRSQLTDFEQDVLMSRILDPSEKQHKAIFEDICGNRNKKFIEIEDLELYAAKRASWRAGDRSQIYYTDNVVYENYVAYMNAHPEIPRLGENMRYPSNIIVQRRETEAQWKVNNDQMTSNYDILADLGDRDIRFKQSVEKQETRGRIRNGHNISPTPSPIMRTQSNPNPVPQSITSAQARKIKRRKRNNAARKRGKTRITYTSRTVRQKTRNVEQPTTDHNSMGILQNVLGTPAQPNVRTL